MEDLKYFCSHLFTSLSFDQKGQVRVCCNNYETPKDKDGNPILITDKDFSMKKAFNSDVHTRIRKNILASKCKIEKFGFFHDSKLFKNNLLRQKVSSLGQEMVD